MKSFPTKTIRSWSEFEEIVGKHSYRGWVYRGQVDATWPLKSSLFRAYEEVEKITKENTGKKKKINRDGHERIALQRFVNNAHLYSNNLPPKERPLEWFAIMQHYGAPTRLLDFTFSPYVAAYFAIENGSDDSAIYCLKHSLFRQVDKDLYDNLNELYEKILDEDSDVIYVYEPEFSTERLMIQQGLFLIPGTNDDSHEEIVLQYGKAISDKHCFKLIIPKRLRSTVLKQLRKMNMTASNLFPGLDGFCKSFKYQSLFPLRSEKRIGLP